MIKKINATDLRLGMYVSQLDRSWLDTPFFFHKLLVKSPQQLSQLKAHCRYVYIDTDKGKDTDQQLPNREVDPGMLEQILESKGSDVPSSSLGQVPLAKEFAMAREVQEKAKQVVDQILEDTRLGKSINTLEARDAVENIIDSVIRNRDALVCLAQIKNKDEYTALHSLNVSILSVAFGRSLNLSREALQILGIGGLLHDIGKMKVPLELLNKPAQLTDGEFLQMKNHVRYGAEILNRIPLFPHKAVLMVAQHHERYGGHGYLKGLRGDQVSLFGQIATVVDVYDAITSDRVYRRGILPHEALKRMFEWSPRDFDRGLLEKFIKGVGIYPVGSLVEINQSDVGIVVAANPVRALKPDVLLIKKKGGQDFIPARLVPLNPIEPSSEKDLWRITNVLDPIQEGVSIKSYLFDEISPTSL
jgi:putative nucleotidyltransferase with HDIG domain